MPCKQKLLNHLVPWSLKLNLCYEWESKVWLMPHKSEEFKKGKKLEKEATNLFSGLR